MVVGPVSPGLRVLLRISGEPLPLPGEPLPWPRRISRRCVKSRETRWGDPTGDPTMGLGDLETKSPHEEPER